MKSAALKLTEELITNSVNNGNVTWPNLKSNLSQELGKTKETVEENDWNFIAQYITGRGIMLNEGLGDTEKILLSLHEFQHYAEHASGAYKASDEESVDDNAALAISFLINNISNDETINEINNLKDSLYYEKLFKVV